MPRSSSRRPARNNASGARLKVTYRRIAELRVNPKNPRIHNRGQRRQIARSIRLFGFCVPILIDANDNVIAGRVVG
jgi:ParB-like chromosome segregation protein Spo0J